MKPVFVDNRDGNTLAKAITAHLKFLREEGHTPEELCIASAFFNPRGLSLISTEVQNVNQIKLLLGADPSPEALRPRRRPGDPKDPVFTQIQVNHGLEKLVNGIRHDRDLLPFEPETDKAVRRLLDFLTSEKIEVKRYRGHFLHAKAYIFRGNHRGVLAGSSNLTYGGLRTNLELNLGHYDDPLISEVETWFDELWEEAEPFDLAAIYEELLEEYPPYLVFMKVLWHLYGEEILLEEQEVGQIPVTTFQKHGVWRAQKILEKYGGVLVADGVGLGKTFIGGDLIRQYRSRRQRVLLLSPAFLRDTEWKKFLNKYQLLVDSLSYEQLANDNQLGGDQEHLPNPVDDYALVVVDEAHNYRNPDTPNRAAILRKLLSGRRRDVLFLSATPVNNSLWDLYHLLRFFLKQDASLAERGVLSIRERFNQAMNEDPFNLNPDLLYPIIDATTVKRTREFVKNHYAQDTIPGPDGSPIPIRFPRPHASSIRYSLDEVLPGFLERFEEILMPEQGEPLLRMARYKPENYPVDKEPFPEDTALVGLLRSILLKRFESSTYAFRLTLERMVNEHETFLKALDKGAVIRKEFLRELAASDDETSMDELLEMSESVEDAKSFNVGALRKDVESDLSLIKEMAEIASSVKSEDSPKLKALIEELVAITEHAHSDANDSEDEQQKHKVLLFSYYEDTIDLLEEQLLIAIEDDKRLKNYRGRVASVSGTEVRRGISRQKAIQGFAPISTGAIPGNDKDLYDILLSTDVLAEGMNLQQCRNVINYDLPWNPMRLVQRHGRIDRINSRYGDVYLRTFFPDDKLNELLDLEERVRRKLAQAAASVGVEQAPIPGGATGQQTFTETREEIERLFREDASLYEAGATKSAAQTGEEYRQQLREALENYGDAIKRLPWKVGSGMARGSQSGYFFCAEVGDRIFLRFVPAEQDAEIIGELGTCLRFIECTPDTPRELSQGMADKVYDAWEVGKQSILEEWQFQTDPANLQPKIRKLNREVADYLRAFPPKDVEAERLRRCLNIVEAPWSRREENELRKVYADEFSDSFEKSTALIKTIEGLGIEPLEVPEPLPLIELEDIHLICWLSIMPSEEGQGEAAD